MTNKTYMEGLNKNQNSIETPENKIKEGVDFVFEQNPELISVGTKEQYYQYLDTIFPDSKDKNIWYHGTNSNHNEIVKFKPSKDGTFGPGIYLQSKYGKYHTETFGANVIAAIVNIKKIFDFNKDGRELVKVLQEKHKGLGSGTMFALQNTISQDGYDSIIDSVDNNQNLLVMSPTPYVVFGPANTHILGSKQDIEDFKNFVSKI